MEPFGIFRAKVQDDWLPVVSENELQGCLAHRRPGCHSNAIACFQSASWLGSVSDRRVGSWLA